MSWGSVSWGDVAWGSVSWGCLLGSVSWGGVSWAGVLGGRGQLPGPCAPCPVAHTHGWGPDVEAEEETQGGVWFRKSGRQQRRRDWRGCRAREWRALQVSERLPCHPAATPGFHLRQREAPAPRVHCGAQHSGAVGSPWGLPWGPPGVRTPHSHRQAGPIPGRGTRSHSRATAETQHGQISK